MRLELKVYRRPLFWVVAGMTLVALVLGLGLAYFSAELSSVFEDENHYRNYNDSLDSLLQNLTNAETGQRGYLITRDADYLSPYHQALPKINSEISDIKNNPLSKKYPSEISQITTLTDKKLQELTKTIDIADSQGQDASFAEVNTNTGKTEMDNIRGLIGRVTDSQDRIIERETTDEAQRTNVLKYTAFVFGLVDIVLIVLILRLTQRAIHKEQQVEGMKEQFVALASHQLRTPATAVKQYIHMLLGDMFGELKKEQRAVLNIINDSNERGIQIANNLLNISKADSGEANLSDEPINLSVLLNHVMDHYTQALRDKRQQEIIRKIPKKPIMAVVDEFYIRLVFENLVENASKYSDDGSKIHVALKQVDEDILFSVKDQGQGISKKDLPLLFKRFSRLDQGAKIADGSGLGLYLVKQAADMHGGGVSVDSKPGKGSTFTVTIKKNPLKTL